MNFEELISVAKRNDHYNQSNAQVKRFSTQLPAPKKETPKTRALSNNIRSFLARKEEEEKQKQIEAEIQKEKLLALRAKDKKATARVKRMTHRTKEVNRAVLDDAKVAAKELQGNIDAQPDEDDYGFESAEASQLYQRIMAKYKDTGSKTSPFSPKKRPKLGDLSGTKDRVKEAIMKEQGEEVDEFGNRRKRRRRKPKDQSGGAEGAESEEDVSEDEESASKSDAKGRPKAAPPPLSFHEILRLAQEKSSLPAAAFTPPPPKSNSEPEFEFDRPMTKKEKEEYLRERESKLRREGKLPRKEVPPQPPPQVPKVVKGRIPKKQDALSGKKEEAPMPKVAPKELPKSHMLQKSPSKLQQARPEIKKEVTSTAMKPMPQPIPSALKSSSQMKTMVKPGSAIKPSPKPSTVSRPPIDAPRPSTSMAKPSENKPAGSFSRPPGSAPKSVSGGPKPPGSASGITQRPPNSTMRPGMQRPAGMAPRPSGSAPRPPGHPMHRPMERRKPGFPGKRRIIESDDEEDPEMDDFIDDGPGEEEDVSKYIKEIFGYDRNRYRGMPLDDEDECMESTFAQQMKEEVISKNIGIMEDLEDIRRENEEKKRMAQKKKKTKGK